jgi:DDE superfamily endonuclease
MWCVPEINDEYITRMEDVLRLYARPHNPDAPVVCFDERPVQLHDSARGAKPGGPGKLGRFDYEYVRRGTGNVFCIIEPVTGKRLTHATKNRTGRAFAQAMRKVARRYSRAKQIHMVVDNLSSHSEKSLTDTFGNTEGAALWRRFAIHYTPKHASWLNAAEMEAGLVSRECLGRRRIGTLAALKTEVTAWSRRAQKARRTINWKFTVNDARRVFRYAGIATRGSEH